MLALFKNNTRAVLGIDISAASIKLLELGRKGGSVRVEHYASCPLPAGAVIDKDIVDLGLVGAALGKLVAAASTRTRRAAVAVPGSSVISKVIELGASLSDSEIESQIAVEADRYIPYPLHEVAIDFERRQSSRMREDLVEVLLVACKKDGVERRAEALAAGGLEAVVVDIETHVMERAFALLCRQMGLGPAGLVAIMDVGAGMSTLYILRDGVCIHVREQVLEPFQDELIAQLGRSLQFFFSSSQYSAVGLIILAGTAAGTPGLADRMQGVLATPTVVADPFAGMRLGRKVNRSQLRNDAAALLLACGLALRGLS